MKFLRSVESLYAELRLAWSMNVPFGQNVTWNVFYLGTRSSGDRRERGDVMLANEFNLSLAEVVARHMRVIGIWPCCTERDIVECADCMGQLMTWRFDALAFLKEGDFFDSIDDIVEPVEGMQVNIRREGIVLRYRYSKGRWIGIGDLPDKVYY